jgi:hypothetical protein
MARFDAFSSDQDSLFNYAKFSPSNGSLASLTMNDSTCVQKFRERSSRLFDIENEKNQLIQVSHPASGTWLEDEADDKLRRICFIDLTRRRSSLNKFGLITNARHIIIVNNSCERLCCRIS